MAVIFFLACSFFNLLKLIMMSHDPIEIGFVSLGFSFMITGLVKYKMEKVEADKNRLSVD